MCDLEWFPKDWVTNKEYGSPCTCMQQNKDCKSRLDVHYSGICDHLSENPHSSHKHGIEKNKI